MEIGMPSHMVNYFDLAKNDKKLWPELDLVEELRYDSNMTNEA